MSIDIEVGDVVEVPAKHNRVWAGRGVVTAYRPGYSVSVRMTTGRFTGESGGFSPHQLVVISRVERIDVKAEITELIAQLKRDEQNLSDLSRGEDVRLWGKSQGVALALSKLEDLKKRVYGE